jgi:hypothetical protein
MALSSLSDLLVIIKYLLTFYGFFLPPSEDSMQKGRCKTREYSPRRAFWLGPSTAKKIIFTLIPTVRSPHLYKGNTDKRGKKATDTYFLQVSNNSIACGVSKTSSPKTAKIKMLL